MVPDIDRVRQWLDAALQHADGTHTVDHVLEGCRTGAFQLWLGENCVLVTEIVTYPLRRDLNYWLAGGDLEELKSLEPGVNAWARACGCTRITGGGRTGWAKVYPGMKRTLILSREI